MNIISIYPSEKALWTGKAVYAIPIAALRSPGAEATHTCPGKVKI